MEDKKAPWPYEKYMALSWRQETRGGGAEQGRTPPPPPVPPAHHRKPDESPSSRELKIERADTTSLMTPHEEQGGRGRGERRVPAHFSLSARSQVPSARCLANTTGHSSASQT